MEKKNTLFKNTIYKSILSMVNIVIPLIIGPYITRLLDIELYGIYNKTENKYQDIKQIENKEWFCVKENDKYKIINQNEETTVDLEFDDVKQIKNNVIVYTKNKKYGAYNIETKKKIDCKYNELKYTCENNFIAKSGNSYGIIDIENNVKLKLEYANIQYYEKAQNTIIKSYFDKRVYIQSSLRMDEDEKINNELDSLKITGDFFKKIIIRNDISKTFFDDNGIMHVSLLDFLLGNVELF